MVEKEFLARLERCVVLETALEGPPQPVLSLRDKGFGVNYLSIFTALARIIHHHVEKALAGVILFALLLGIFWGSQILVEFVVCSI